MRLSAELLRLSHLSRSVKASGKSAHDTEMQTQVKRQAEELEDLKQKIKQSKTDLDREMKVIEKTTGKS